MNAVVSGETPRRMPDAMRQALRQGKKVGHVCSSAVGFVAIVSALALWFQPSWRGIIAERVLPLLTTRTQADPAAVGVLTTYASHQTDPASALAAPSPDDLTDVFGKTDLTEVSNRAVLSNASAHGGVSLGPFSAPLDPSNLPSVVRLAQPIKIVAEARYDRMVGTSTPDQQRVAYYIAHKYRVAQEPIDVLVHAAFQTGRDVGLDPLLLLAVMGVESGFNPYAESGVGARGLMQVMPTVHSDKFDYYGGPQAALEPVPNLRVGALILKNYIGSTGSVAGGLKRYVGATGNDDGGYGARVVAERARLRVALKQPLPSPVTTAATVVASTTKPVAQKPQPDAHSAAAAVGTVGTVGAGNSEAGAAAPQAAAGGGAAIGNRGVEAIHNTSTRAPVVAPQASLRPA